MTEATKPLVITELQVENVKKVRAIRITPDGSALQVVGGRNAQGKSSLLDAIEITLNGSKSIPAEPLRRGTRKGGTSLGLGQRGLPPEFVVERKLLHGGSPTLVIRDAEGKKQSSPQALLDALCAAISFDPFAFARLDPTKQDEQLRQVLGDEFNAAWAELEAKRGATYDKRTDDNRRLKELTARFHAMPEHTGVPKEEVSIKALSDTLSNAREQAHARAMAENRVSAAQQLVDRASSEVIRLSAELRAAEERVAKERRAHTEASEALKALPLPVDTTETEKQRDTAEDTNRKVRENLERLRVDEQIKSLEKVVQGHSDAIEGLDEQKQELLAGAKFPVDGLGFNELGPTLNGLPLKQASSAEQLRVSVALGFALNPRVKVLLVREGSLLDSTALKLLAEMAEEQGGQVWLEKVAEGPEGCSIFLEDGEVKAASAAE